MKLYSSFESLPEAPRRAALTIGVFDGCHLGHKALLQKTLEIARTNGVKAGVITFSSHPNLILHPERPLRLLISPEARLRFFEEMGFDFGVIIPFNEQLRHTSAERFIQSYLVEGLDISHLVMGYDSHFGAERRGDATLARSELEPLGIKVDEVAAVDRDGPISSTRIRQLLREADIDGATELLGHRYSVYGRIGHGDRRGRSLGFPTANLIVKFDMPLPDGVWAARATLPDGRSYLAAVHWGPRPTFSDATTPNSHLEAHLLGFEGDLYGSKLEVSFIARIRNQKRFSNPTELCAQIEKDIAQIRALNV